MCLNILEEETKETKRTHPRFLKWWKNLVIFDGEVKSPVYDYFKWTQEWTEALHTLKHNPLSIEGGAIHVLKDKTQIYPRGNLGIRYDNSLERWQWHVMIPVYGCRQDFIAVGWQNSFERSIYDACYKKVYITKVAWRKIIGPAISKLRKWEAKRSCFCSGHCVCGNYRDLQMEL